MTDQELIEKIAAIPYWYHKIPLRDGVVTPGWAPLSLDAYRLPEDMTGKTVLDVGAWDGGFTFEAIRRGAKHVTAIDDFSDTCGGDTNASRSGEWETFDLCASALGVQDRCIRESMSVYDVDKFGMQYDYVFFFGTFYHLQHPLLALEKLRNACRGSIFVESAITDGCQSAYTDYVYSGEECVLEFYPGAEYGKNTSNWYVPTLKCLRAMVRTADFTNVIAWKLTDEPDHVSKCRGFVRGDV